VREYTTRDVAGLTRLSASQIRRWARAGIILPRKDDDGHWRYSFQDLALLRTARQLLDAHLSLHRVTRALRTLRAQLPGRPLSAVRILVIGRRVVVRDRLASWEPESGQTTLAFDLKALTEHVAATMPLGPRPLPEAPAASADDIYQSALDLELAGLGDEAKRAYEAALDRDPKLVGARINLGRLMHAANRLAEAEAMYRAALKDDSANALAAFNLGVVLEDQDQTDAAVAAYRRVLEIDETYADAHFNLSRLLESRGDKRGALRHLSRFKRLMRGDG
jgi:tetratricopeptide (TPR) repeat protein